MDKAQLRKLRWALIFGFETLRKLRCGLMFLKFVGDLLRCAFNFFFSVSSASSYVGQNFVSFQSKLSNANLKQINCSFTD